jgi:hypothetical protein
MIVLALVQSDHSGWQLSYRDLVAMMGERGIDLAPFCGGYNITRPNSKSAGIVSPERLAVPDAWMKRTSASRVNGCTCTERRQGWEDRRFLSEPETRRKRRQSLSVQGNEGPADSGEDHAGCLRRFTPRSRQSKGEWRIAEASARPDQQVLEHLNNTIEQDHRRVKQRLRPMLGLKSFRTAAKLY